MRGVLAAPYPRSMAFSLDDLTCPLVAAPMAGGVSTPSLVAAMARAGAIGFLAGGYLSASQVRDDIAAVRSLGASAFGVNLFWPPGRPADLSAAQAYRTLLAPEAERRGVILPQPHDDDDAIEAKLGVVAEEAVPVVSFTFGVPGADVVGRLHRAGCRVWATVTSASEAVIAGRSGVDLLIVQGPDAGGHRATFDPDLAPPTQDLGALVEAVRAVSDLPIVVTGGLTTPEQVGRWRGQVAGVQVGTALLDAEEAGTSPTYRRALRDPEFTSTELTRAFSGRYARGLRNGFMTAFGDQAPAAYPAVHQLTAPLRRAASTQDDPEGMSLWAGTSWTAAPTGPAARILAGLMR